PRRLRRCADGDLRQPLLPAPRREEDRRDDRRSSPRGPRLMAADRTRIVLANMGVDGANTIEGAMKRGAYSRLEKGLGMQPAALVEEVKKSNLRGRGGAGFPTG